jgi:hypothetical protein
VTGRVEFAEICRVSSCSVLCDGLRGHLSVLRCFGINHRRPNQNWRALADLHSVMLIVECGSDLCVLQSGQWIDPQREIFAGPLFFVDHLSPGDFIRRLRPPATNTRR